MIFGPPTINFTSTKKKFGENSLNFGQFGVNLVKFLVARIIQKAL